MNSDLALLPADLASRSLSEHAIILAHADALRALECIAAAGRRLRNWEGWVRFPSGARTHSLAHPGPFILPEDAATAHEIARRTMTEAQQRWERAPEQPGTSLFFELNVAG